MQRYLPSHIPQINVKAIRGDDLKIDLKKTFTGTLKAQMISRKNKNAVRDFEIIDNRYLFLDNSKTVDYKSIDNNKIIEEICGTWYFDVQKEFNNEIETVYSGAIFFYADVTGNKYMSVSYETIQTELQYLL